MQKSQELDQLFDANNSETANDDMMMYGGMLMSGGDRQISTVGFLNNRAVGMHAREFDNQSSNNNNNNDSSNNNPVARDLARFGGNKNNNDHMKTVDFLGVGASRPQITMHDQRLELENVSQQRMQMVQTNNSNNNLFNHRISSHEDSDVEKTLYNAF